MNHGMKNLKEQPLTSSENSGNLKADTKKNLYELKEKDKGQ